MPTKFKNSGKTATFQIRRQGGGWYHQSFHGLDIYIPTDRDYRRYSPRSVAFATMLDWFWRQNAGTAWFWKDSIGSIAHGYMKGVRYPQQERDTYARAKEIIREGFFDLNAEWERGGIVYAYAATRGPNALSGYVDKAFTAVVYDEKNRKMLRLMDNRVTTGTVDPAAAAYGAPTRVVRPKIRTLR